MKGGFEVTHAVVVCVNIPRTSGGAEKTTSDRIYDSRFPGLTFCM
jgi:hypothetical protein